ncbi:hypothetical protein CR513_47628, partial [Mucuna pruriens]
MISSSLIVGSGWKFDNSTLLFFPIRVVSELFGLKGYLPEKCRQMHLVFVAHKPESMSDEEWDFEHQQMSGMGIKFEDEILGLLLLNSLPKSWETFKVSITNSIPNGVVSLQMVNGSVLNKEMRRKAQGSSSQSKENKGKNGKSKEKEDDHVTTTTGDDIIILRDFELVNFVSDESMWIIDNGFTLHVTLGKEFFTAYTVGDFGVLKMGNDGVIKVIIVGDVCLQTNIRMYLWLRGVKHAPKVRFNLIFVHMLDDGGYDNHFGYEKWKLTKGYLVVARGKKISKLYWIKVLVAKDSVKPFSGTLYFVTFIDECSKKLWVYTLKSKDQVLEKFKHFQALVERQSGKKMKCIRSDNGGEYCGLFDAFMDVSKDERSKLDMKTRQCIFIGMHDPVDKNLVRSHDVQFMEDQTIEDIDKVKKSTLEKDKILYEIDPVWMLVHDMDTVDNNVQNGDQQLGDGFDVPLDDDAEEKQDMSQDENLGDAPKPPIVQLSRSNRHKQSSTRSKYIDVRYHWIRNALDVKLLELAKVHTNDNSADMMTKRVSRGKFEACYEIIKLEITST